MTCDNITSSLRNGATIGHAKCHLIPPLLANQLATRVRHFPRIKSGDTCIGFPRHATLPSSTTQNVAVLCPHYRATQATAGIGRSWRQGRGTPPSRLSIVLLGTIRIAVRTCLSRFSSLQRRINPLSATQHDRAAHFSSTDEERRSKFDNAFSVFYRNS